MANRKYRKTSRNACLSQALIAKALETNNYAQEIVKVSLQGSTTAMSA